MNGRTARLLVTRRCGRRCDGCANTYPSLMAQARVVASLEEVSRYAAVCVTGGEPLRDVDRTEAILHRIRDLAGSRQAVYLYTALFVPDLWRLLPLLDGVHFSLHAEATMDDAVDFAELQRVAALWRDKSWRLYVDARLTQPVFLVPSLWARVEVKPWRTEGDCPLPAHEDLLVLESPEWPEG
jgi:organic radical activating enzyme